MKPVSSIVACLSLVTFTACGGASPDASIGDEIAPPGGGTEQKSVGSVAQAAVFNVQAFAWASEPGTSHTPQVDYSFNSTHGRIFVERTAVGRYLVHFGGITTVSGSPQVVAYGADTNRCQMAGLGIQQGEMLLAVDCRNTAGAFADSRFVASYDETLRNAPSDAAFAACVQGDRDHTPPAATTFNPSGGATRVIREGTGLYTMRFFGLASFRGVPMVTPMGEQDHICSVRDYYTLGADSLFRIACFDRNGARQDAIFALKYEARNAAAYLPSDTAFLWANDTVTASYFPNPEYSWNSIRHSNTVNFAGNAPAAQFAAFPSFPVSDATHHSSLLVTGYDSTAAPVYCKPQSWFTAAGGGVTGYVQCFRPGGIPVKSKFLSLYTNRNGA